MICEVEIGLRFECLALEEAVALAEIGGCVAEGSRGRLLYFKCDDCGIFKRGALIKSIGGVRVPKPRPKIERSVKTLDHITSRVMVNLARVAEGHKVWEPFVGTGAIAYEVERVGGHVVGGDLDIKSLRLAKRNIAGDLVQMDATMPALRGKFDASVGDPPYGRLSAASLEVRALITAFLEAAIALVKSGGYIVVASPIYVDIPYFKSCAMYLHGGLYRVVYIIRVGA